MKVGTQINKGYKCPVCKEFGLKPMHKVIGMYTVMPQEGFEENGIYNYYDCRNCYAEFNVIENSDKK